MGSQLAGLSRHGPNSKRGNARRTTYGVPDAYHARKENYIRGERCPCPPTLTGHVSVSRFVPSPVIEEPACADCLAHGGLCASHRFEVLPERLRPLRSNWPVRLMGVTHYDEAQEESADARQV